MSINTFDTAHEELLVGGKGYFVLDLLNFVIVLMIRVRIFITVEWFIFCSCIFHVFVIRAFVFLILISRGRIIIYHLPAGIFLASII
ncbi:hypothetical protein K458DRAFT_392021 [Lentithecium fluviatile CBS 122367]|uniref:Uncharacterized protein n=1 Tax=Lentithecium fluviatile CBS 122367 TaxID=1168545 RepID=A0A6G1ITM8_9PLEO|nr:hypothetical protein K458DRAFT_392021 [Lentithecium fluviatile CBS 122367]